MPQSDETFNDVMNYYGSLYDEQARLSGTWGQVEFARSQGIIRRYLKQPPALVLDVGGAAGRYACWLAREGYEVHLVDPVPLHIEQAQAASAAQPETPVASCTLGDARQLEAADGLADGMLLMGPLYHLVGAHDRHQALTEAYRVLKPGGHVFAAAISRFASTIDGLASGYYLDPLYWELVLRDLAEGQHRNPTQDPTYFTTAFFHRPDELADEVAGAGFRVTALLAVEGISYLVQNLDAVWGDESQRAFLLELIGKMEQEPSLLGASPHLMCVAEKL
ncbi:MAG: methyltransferase domain-containing protein [Anaerolineae bacterium]|nr:methyltransferase domain-containing protein [Anaerolineae bacterium]